MLHQYQQNKNMVTNNLSQHKGTFWIPDIDTHTSTIKMRVRRNINITLIPTWHKVLATKKYHCCRSANYGRISSSNRLPRLLLGNTINYGGNISKLSINDQMRSSHNNRGANLRNIIPNSKIPVLSNIRKRGCQSLIKFNGQSFQQQKKVSVAEVVEDKACWIALERSVIWETWTSKRQLKNTWVRSTWCDGQLTQFVRHWTSLSRRQTRVRTQDLHDAIYFVGYL